MKKNKKNLRPRNILWVLLGFCIGFLITAVIAIFFGSFLENKKKFLYEGFSIMVKLFVILPGPIAIVFSVLSLRTQKKQWLNESFIKHEADILLGFRKKLGEANGAIHFFLHDLLTIEKKFAFIKDEPPVIKYSDLQYHFNQLVDLNDFYNSYQNIFRKHNLEKHIECIALILESARYIPERDLSYDLILEADNSQTYRLEKRIIAIISSFNFPAHLLHDVDERRPETINEMDAYNQKNKFEELSRLISLTSQKLTSLTFKLDELTTYVDSETASLNFQAMRFFQKK